MQDAVENKNLHLQGAGVTQTTCVVESNLGRDGNFSGGRVPAILRRRFGWKGQDVRRLVGAAETQVERTHLAAAGDQDVDRTLDSGGFAGSKHEPAERLGT